MAWTGWLTGDGGIESYWPGCDAEPWELVVLLEAARIQCEEFAAAAPAGADATVPETWRLAQAMQARALRRSQLAGSGDTIGADGLSVTVFPMDWSVKNLLRPKRGKPVIR